MILVKDFLPGSRVEVFKLSSQVPLEEQKNCPSCTSLLESVCSLESIHGRQKIRFGVCDFCGYAGYIDRPTKDWMVNFYSNEWDKEKPRSKEEVTKNLNLIKIGTKASRYLAFSLINKINSDKNGWVCEIGCGYGEILKNFEIAGFKNLIGIENSKIRANFVKENFGLKILQGDFNSPDVQKELERLKPISLFFSHHVLEHTYDPDKIINRISSLQKIGDNLILSLPNSKGEHINYALFYFVHPHSFSKESLEILLNKNGYEITFDSSPDDTNIIISAQKKENPRPVFKASGNYVNFFKERIRNSLALDKIQNDQSYKLYWEQGFDEMDKNKLEPIGSGLIAQMRWVLEKIKRRARGSLFGRFSRDYVMYLESKKGQTDSPESEIKVYFNDEIQFLIK